METQNLVTKNPLLIIDMNRYVTQKQYCEMKKAENLTLQNLQNMITRNQIAKLYVEEFGITLIDTQADDKETVEVVYEKSTFTKGQIGEHFAKFAMEALLENKFFIRELQEKESVISKQSCELNTRIEMITQSAEHIEALTDQNRDLAKHCDDLQQELEKNVCLVAKQVCELTKQSEMITQSNLEIEELKEFHKKYSETASKMFDELTVKNKDFEAKVAGLEATNLSLTERLEIAKEKALFQADKIQTLNQELNTGLMSKLVELVNKKPEQATEQATEVKPQYFVVLAKNNQTSNKLQEDISDLMKSYKNIMIYDVEDFFITVRTEVDKLNRQSNCEEEFVKLHEFSLENGLHTIEIGEKFQLTIRKVCTSL